jgi:hypothetical protein
MNQNSFFVILFQRLILKVRYHYTRKEKQFCYNAYNAETDAHVVFTQLYVAAGIKKNSAWNKIIEKGIVAMNVIRFN